VISDDLNACIGPLMIDHERCLLWRLARVTLIATRFYCRLARVTLIATRFYCHGKRSTPQRRLFGTLPIEAFAKVIDGLP